MRLQVRLDFHNESLDVFDVSNGDSIENQLDSSLVDGVQVDEAEIAMDPAHLHRAERRVIPRGEQPINRLLGDVRAVVQAEGGDFELTVVAE